MDANTPSYHKTVMLQESLAGLAIKPQGKYVDLTFGGGGHAKAILAQLKGGQLFAFDQDHHAAQLARGITSKAFTFIQANARFMQQFLIFHGVRAVDGILADLGVSSYQLDTPARGFSTRFDATLDMRMDCEAALTAHKVVNSYSIDQLTQLLRNYGEVRHARALANAIVATRVYKPINTTKELKSVMQRFAPGKKVFKYYAKVFQAFRIEVNDELGALKDILTQSAKMLKKQGRLVVVSYHSLEDRLVKNFLHKGNFEGVVQQDSYGNLIRSFRPIYKKPITPAAAEVQANNRARSAKLRVGEYCLA